MSLPKYTIIDTAGQWTPIIEGVFNPAKMAILGNQLLNCYSFAGQVAFVNLENTIPYLNMMGNELSVNGAIAGGFYLSQKFNRNTITFFSSGCTSKLKTSVNKNVTTLTIPTSIISQQKNNEIRFTGIKYKLISTQKFVNLPDARRYCDKDLAAGYIFESEPGKIVPIVYVRATNTLTVETACGSASLAYYLLTGLSQIKQPSGSYINITQNSVTLTLCQHNFSNHPKAFGIFCPKKNAPGILWWVN